jgi:hypothetical protein
VYLAFLVIKKLNIMAENTKGQGLEKNRRTEDNRSAQGEQANYQKASGDRSGSSSLDEKSSTMGRRDKGTGMATKDGLTGSDYDGQVTE